MNVFYSKEIKKHKITLRDQEAMHCSKVLRKKEGAEVIVVDGMGGRYRCEIESVQRQSVDLLVTDSEQILQDNQLPHIAFGIIKNTSRLEWLLEKITEIGVSRITPILSARCERKKLNHERLTKIIVSAMKQSLRCHLPVFDSPVSLRAFLEQGSYSNGFIASYGEGVPELAAEVNKDEPSTLLIGPEGDFTTDEVQLAVNAGFKRVNLGHARLRAETAAVVATTIANFQKTT